MISQWTFSGSLGNWVSKPDTKVSSEGILIGVNPGEHQCSIENGQCYWTDIETAMEECFHWTSCHFILESDKIVPAKIGGPLFWAMKNSALESSNGDRTWALEGNFKKKYCCSTADSIL